MQKLFIISIVLFSSVLFSCSNSSKTETKTSTTAKKVYYTCPMHPEVKSDKPGKCPKCEGMDLEKREE